ncbi:MAG: DUF1080 domain-containing protein [Prevotellaceae bacterium]|jgi:hypothetical protein|nr:DUF1080 domain-containing protein [Prevotellaceae bacterium]
MIKKLFLCVLSIITCLIAHAGPGGKKPLFAADLSNADYSPAVWSIDANGVISATADQAIWTTREYKNFELELEFKTDKCTNSGVVIYCTDKKNWIPNAVEIQIADDYCDHFEQSASTASCGAVYGHLAPSGFKIVKKPGEWNKMKITAKGKNIKVALNGKKITAMDMNLWTSGTTNPDGSSIPSWMPKPFAELPAGGYIGFQGKHGEAFIWFRNIKIKEL